MTLTHVTQKLLDTSILCDSKLCAVAQALKRKDYCYPIVDCESISYHNLDAEQEITKPMTIELSRKIQAIDNNKRRIKPFFIEETEHNFRIFRPKKNQLKLDIVYNLLELGRTPISRKHRAEAAKMVREGFLTGRYGSYFFTDKGLALTKLWFYNY